MNKIIQFENYNTEEIKKMSGKGKKKNKFVNGVVTPEQNNSNQKENQDISKPSNNSNKLNNMGVIIAIITGILGVVVIFTNVIRTFDRLLFNVEKLNESVDNLQADIGKIETDLDLLKSETKTNTENILEILPLTEFEYATAIEWKVEIKEVDNEKFLSEPVINDNNSAKDQNSDKFFTTIELSNRPLFSSYKENGKETYFYGQFNENNQWVGKCVINVYNGNTLETIFEGIYNNGELYSYKRATCEEDGIWLITDRICKEGYNSGSTWEYTKTSDFIKEFTVDDAIKENILTVDDLLNSKQETLLSYYHGNTSGGLYNDDTNDAYLIIFFEPNTFSAISDVPVIRTLYNGKFVDGQFSESEYDSWYITRKIDTTYMYYKGGFSNNAAKHKDKSKEEFENYLTHEQIDEYLNGSGFQIYSENFLTEYEQKDKEQEN